VPNAASGSTITCTTATNSRVSACEDGFYKTTGGDNSPDTCTACTDVPGAAPGTITCTTADDSSTTACADGFTINDGGRACTPSVCIRPSNTVGYNITSETLTMPSFSVSVNCLDGYYGDPAAAVCGGNDAEYTLNGCSQCTDVPNAAPGATITCTTATNSRVSACADGFYKTDNTGSDQSDTCTACTPVPNADPDAGITCTTGSDSRITSCATGYVIVHAEDGSSDTCIQSVNNVDCNGNWSDCTARCERASERTFVQTRDQEGDGRSCDDWQQLNQAQDCTDGEDTCVYRCSAPAITEPYNITGDNLTIQGFNINATCSDGYRGTPEVTRCNSHGGEYTLSGCSMITSDTSGQETSPESPETPDTSGGDSTINIGYIFLVILVILVVLFVAAYLKIPIFKMKINSLIGRNTLE